jgi:hypothetical protein
MTFQNYLRAITEKNEIFCIQEWCEGRFIGTHLLFGIIEDTECEFDKHYFYQENIYDSPTYINPLQEVDFLEKKIAVKNHNGNRVELAFFKAEIIKNPDQFIP